MRIKLLTVASALVLSTNVFANTNSSNLEMPSPSRHEYSIETNPLYLLAGGLSLGVAKNLGSGLSIVGDYTSLTSYTNSYSQRLSVDILNIKLAKNFSGSMSESGFILAGGMVNAKVDYLGLKLSGTSLSAETSYAWVGDNMGMKLGADYFVGQGGLGVVPVLKVTVGL